MTLALYAIVDRRPTEVKRLGRGVARQPLSLLRCGKVFVVVEALGAKQGAPTPTPTAMVAHDRVVRRIARLCPAVLPLRFGSIAPDRAAVHALVDPIGERLDGAFDRVRDAVQFTLRVTGRPARRTPAKVDRRTGPGTKWLAERLARQQIPEVASITTATRPFVRETRAERQVDAAPRIGAVYHLVARTDVRKWRAALEEGLEALPRTVHVSVTGPWPPWAFAELG